MQPSVNEAEARSETEKIAQGERRAANIRYGQTLSEQGFTGTVDATGVSDGKGMTRPNLVRR